MRHLGWGNVSRYTWQVLKLGEDCMMERVRQGGRREEVDSLGLGDGLNIEKSRESN